jgi:hypothetical protein
LVSTKIPAQGLRKKQEIIYNFISVHDCL